MTTPSSLKAAREFFTAFGFVLDEDSKAVEGLAITIDRAKQEERERIAKIFSNGDWDDGALIDFIGSGNGGEGDFYAEMIRTRTSD